MNGPVPFLPCDVCGANHPQFLLSSARLDGPLVECTNCGFRYVGKRRRSLAFGTQAADEVTAQLSEANTAFRHLRLEEEHRLALLNAKWRLELIRKVRPSGKLLEIGCARGDFMRGSMEYFYVSGVETT